MNSISKKFVGFSILVAVLAVAAVAAPAKADQISDLQAQIASLTALVSSLQGGASAAATSYTRDLTVGSRGADVSSLQGLLVSKGFLVMPAGVSMGYFGNLTKTAVAAWQASAGITPAAGYFGAKSRAAVAAMGGGTSVTPVPVTPGTPNPITPGGTVGVEGSFTALLAASPANNANIRTSVNVPVYGIDIKAIKSDMSVDRADLQFTVTPSGGSAQNPGSFINTISVMDGSTVLKSVSVSTSDFSKDSSDRYHVIISGLGFKVPANTTKTITFAINVSSINSTDSNRVVTVQGYAGNSNNIRATDSAGFQSYVDMSGSSNTRTHTFKPAGASNITATINNAGTPKSNTVKLSTTDGVSKTTLFSFDAKSDTGDSTITKIYVKAGATSTAGLPTTLYLYDGSNLLGSVSGPTVSGVEVLFNTLNIPIAQDTSKTLTVKADFPSTAGGQAASSSLAVNSIQWQKGDGTLASTSPLSTIVGNDQYMYNAAPIWTLVSANSTANAGVVGVASSSVTGTIVLQAKAVGGAMTKPVIGDFTLVFASTTRANGSYTTITSGGAQNALVASTTGISVSPSDATVGDGGTYTVTLTGSAFSNIGGTLEAGSSQSLFMAVKDIDAVVGGLTFTNQTWGIDDFYTPAKVLTRGTL